MTAAITNAYDASIAIRDDLQAAHARAWAHLARPGAWWAGAERIAITAETRHAASCRLCQERQAARSPAAVAGDGGGGHDCLGSLPPAAVEVVHRVCTDPGHLTEGWYRGVIADGLSAERYVETVSVVAHVVAIDTMMRGIGRDPPPLPAPEPGMPPAFAGAGLHGRPRGARPGAAWVPWVEPEDAEAGELGHYPADGRPAANIVKALSLVPVEAESFFDLVGHQYLPGPAMRDFTREYRAISHAQIELLAARVSALNQCLY
jgi:hypothetical protein